VRINDIYFYFGDAYLDRFQIFNRFLSWNIDDVLVFLIKEFGPI